jgi:hypothetical protein
MFAGLTVRSEDGGNIFRRNTGLFLQSILISGQRNVGYRGLISNVLKQAVETAIVKVKLSLGFIN